MKLSEFKLTDHEHFITEAELYEMARVQKKDSGINVVMYVSTKDVVQGRHGPRIKVSNIVGTFSSTNNFSISISTEPSVMSGKVEIGTNTLEDIFDFIKINVEPLLKYWSNQYDSDSDFYKELKSL